MPAVLAAAPAAASAQLPAHCSSVACEASGHAALTHPTQRVALPAAPSCHQPSSGAGRTAAAVTGAGSWHVAADGAADWNAVGTAAAVRAARAADARAVPGPCPAVGCQQTPPTGGRVSAAYDF